MLTGQILQTTQNIDRNQLPVEDLAILEFDAPIYYFAGRNTVSIGVSGAQSVKYTTCSPITVMVRLSRVSKFESLE